MSKVAVGPLTEEEAGIHRFGDIANFADELRKVIESGNRLAERPN